MRLLHAAPVVLLAMAVLLSACAPASPGRAGGPQWIGAGAQAQESVRPKGSITIAWPLEPENLSPKFLTGGGVSDFAWLFNSFLTYYDDTGTSHPMITRQVPSRDNGDWVINPDGTMVTIYRLRPNARWHDGTPLTAYDFAFAFPIYTDPELPVALRAPENLMSKVEARDDHTLVITWREPFVRANALSYQEMSPLPRHLLEEKHRARQVNFVSGEEWTSAYIGTGPFRVERWTPGSGLIARAYPDWFLGAPKLETIDIRFVQDANVMLANLLAGEVDLINSPGVRANEAAVAREQWVARGEGYLKTWSTRLSLLEFQYRAVPGWQQVVTDVRVRQALTHAMDRQSMADTVARGLVPAAEMFVSPSDPLYAEADRAITKYPYDPNRAVGLLAEAGWRKGQRADLLSNAAGHTLDIDNWSSPGQQQTLTIVVDNWKSVGVNSSMYVVPAHRARDHAFVTSFPGANVTTRAVDPRYFTFTSRDLPTAENRFVGLNRGGFSDEEIERLYTLWTASFEEHQRRQANVGIQKRMSELAGYAPLHYLVEVILAKHRLKGPVGNYWGQSGITWNVFAWEVLE